MMESQKTVARLQDHLKALTRVIGERSVYFPENLEKAADYIVSVYQDMGLQVRLEPYMYRGFKVTNVVAELSFGANPSQHYLLGAHYDSVTGSVGADDNASSIAVQIETARSLKAWEDREDLDLAMKLVSFALEEPPVFNTPYMGSKVYTRKARKEGEKIDGMICLEMVGYTCHERGCQGYPFPLMFMGYPKKGDFIGLVGNFGSRQLTLNLYNAFQKNPNLPVVKLLVPFKGGFVPAIRLSDHSSFWDLGYNAVMVTDSAFYRNPHYHLPSDTMEKLDYNFMAEVVKSLLIFFQSHHAD